MRVTSIIIVISLLYNLSVEFENVFTFPKSWNQTKLYESFCSYIFFVNDKSRRTKINKNNEVMKWNDIIKEGLSKIDYLMAKMELKSK